MQGEIGDEVRGRVFALYDAVFNVCYVLAVAAAALLSPPTGTPRWLLAGAAGVYLLGLLAHERAAAPRPPAPPAASGAPTHRTTHSCTGLTRR